MCVCATQPLPARLGLGKTRTHEVVVEVVVVYLEQPGKLAADVMHERLGAVAGAV